MLSCKKSRSRQSLVNLLLSETQLLDLQHRFSISCGVQRQWPHLHHSGSGSVDLRTSTAVGGGANEELSLLMEDCDKLNAVDVTGVSGTGIDGSELETVVGGHALQSHPLGLP